MRLTKQQGGISIRGIAGNHVILMALNCAEEKLNGLMGFAFKRETVGGPPTDWLNGLKVFKELSPDPSPGSEYSTFENPIQSFLWSDYTVQPDTEYKFTIAAMYGAPGKLKARDTLTFQIKTEKADDGKHGIWFNRGSIASQAFAREFDNAQMTDNTANDPQNKLTRWLSRGLLEACLNFIDQIPAGDGLRVCAYEFTYQPILNALNSALRRGVNVKIVYHKTSANDRAIKTAGLPTQTNGKRILFERTRPKIPHNKFIVRLEHDDKPVSVWTGSTNFTSTGFLGQTNVGHLVTEPATAAKYLQFWTELSDNPTLKPAIAQAVALTPNPANLIPKEPITPVFSPRSDDSMLDWYAQRIVDSKTSAVFTGAFGVAPKLLEALEKRSDSVRFILLEKPPTADIRDAEARNRDDVLVSYGAVLGMDYQRKTDSAGNRTLVPIPNFELDKWFFKEELARQNGIGFVFFIHTKFLLVDPLSDDPLVCTGSANFSTGSLTSNDENMLQIRGDTRVADIYLTEFDRIFRHFYFRDIANELAEKGRNSETVFLDSTDTWTKNTSIRPNSSVIAERCSSPIRVRIGLCRHNKISTHLSMRPRPIKRPGIQPGDETGLPSIGRRNQLELQTRHQQSKEPKTLRCCELDRMAQQKQPKERRVAARARLTGRKAIRHAA